MARHVPVRNKGTNGWLPDDSMILGRSLSCEFMDVPQIDELTRQAIVDEPCRSSRMRTKFTECSTWNGP